MNIIIPILILITSAIIAIYVLVSKNIKIIASIEPDRVPKHLINKFSIYFSISLMISSICIAAGVYLAEINLWASILIVIIGLLVLLPFYLYYNKIQK